MSEQTQTALALDVLPGDVADFKLDDMDRSRADELLTENQAVNESLRAFSLATENYVGAFRGVLVAMRSAQIVGREAQIVLSRAGWSKVRISEAKRLIECDERTWKQFAAAEISVKLALQQARHELPAGGRAYTVPALQKFFIDTVNGYNGPKPAKLVTLKTDRLDCVFELRVKPVKVRTQKPAKAKKNKGKK